MLIFKVSFVSEDNFQSESVFELNHQIVYEAMQE
jgi:hypothetical protein